MGITVNGYASKSEVKSSNFNYNPLYCKQDKAVDEPMLKMKDTFNDDFNEMVRYSWIS